MHTPEAGVHTLNVCPTQALTGAVDGPGGGPDGEWSGFRASVWGVGGGGSWLSLAAAGSAADLPEATQMDEAEQVAVPWGHAGTPTPPRLAWPHTRLTPSETSRAHPAPARAGTHVHAHTRVCTHTHAHTVFVKLRAGLSAQQLSSWLPSTAEGSGGGGGTRKGWCPQEPYLAWSRSANGHRADRDSGGHEWDQPRNGPAGSWRAWGGGVNMIKYRMPS